MRSKVIALLLSTAVTITALSGCQNNSSQTSSSVENSEAQSSDETANSSTNISDVSTSDYSSNSTDEASEGSTLFSSYEDLIASLHDNNFLMSFSLERVIKSFLLYDGMKTFFLISESWDA